MTRISEVFDKAKKKGWNDFTSLSEQRDTIILSIIQKWLREEHSLHIQIGMQGINYYYCAIYGFGNLKGACVQKLKDVETELFTTYEEALMGGIEEALNFIK